MSDRIHTLLYRDVAVGTIRPTDVDFPNCCGTFVPTKDTDPPATRERIARFIEYCRESERLMLSLDDDAPDNAWEQFESTHEDEFVDLIECGDWWLVDETGERHPILVPNFGQDDVVWRWDTSRP